MADHQPQSKPLVERANVWVSVFAAVVALIVGATQQRPASRMPAPESSRCAAKRIQTLCWIGLVRACPRRAVSTAPAFVQARDRIAPVQAPQRVHR